MLQGEKEKVEVEKKLGWRLRLRKSGSTASRYFFRPIVKEASWGGEGGCILISGGGGFYLVPVGWEGVQGGGSGGGSGGGGGMAEMASLILFQSGGEGDRWRGGRLHMRCLVS